jgi:hypothetical protein
MFRARSLLILIALLSLAAVTGRSAMQFVSHCEATCTTQTAASGQNQNSGGCDCTCHHGMAATLSSAEVQWPPALFVCVLADQIQEPTETPPRSIDLPPQLASA